MVRINSAKARLLYNHYRAIIILPEDQVPTKTPVRSLRIQRGLTGGYFPDERVRQYRSLYCTSGQNLAFYVESPKVYIRRTGNGFDLVHADTKQLYRHLECSDIKLVNYVNSNCLEVVNKGYLLPQYRSRIKVDVIE